LAKLTTDESVVRQALVNSTVTIIDDRIKANIKAVGRSTVILREIPSDTSEDEVREIFHFEGCRPIVSIRSDIENTWFVVLETEEDAKEVLLQLMMKKRTFRGEKVKGRLKSETVVRSFYSAPPQMPSTVPPSFVPNMQYSGGYMPMGQMGPMNQMAQMGGAMPVPMNPAYGFMPPATVGGVGGSSGMVDLRDPTLGMQQQMVVGMGGGALPLGQHPIYPPQGMLDPQQQQMQQPMMGGGMGGPMGQPAMRGNNNSSANNGGGSKSGETAHRIGGIPVSVMGPMQQQQQIAMQQQLQQLQMQQQQQQLSMMQQQMQPQQQQHPHQQQMQVGPSMVTPMQPSSKLPRQQQANYPRDGGAGAGGVAVRGGESGREGGGGGAREGNARNTAGSVGVDGRTR